MPVLLPLASGKGGVGKSAIAANLAFRLASIGKTVILADMDLGAANAHTILGYKNNKPGLGEYIVQKTTSLADIVVPLDYPHLFFIPGDGLIPGSANMSFGRKRRLIREMKELQADYVILDLGAGTHFNTVDVFLACGLGFVVTSPEPTSVLNAYSFIKNGLFRLLYNAVSAKDPCRQIIKDFFMGRLEQGSDAKTSEDPLLPMLKKVDLLNPEAGQTLRGLRERFCPRIIINMGKHIQELSLGSRLRQICARHLGMNIEYIAFVPWDDKVRQSILDRKLLFASDPGSPFCKAVATMAERIQSRSFGEALAPIEDFADLRALAEEAGEI